MWPLEANLPFFDTWVLTTLRVPEQMPLQARVLVVVGVTAVVVVVVVVIAAALVVVLVVTAISSSSVGTEMAIHTFSKCFF